MWSLEGWPRPLGGNLTIRCLAAGETYIFAADRILDPAADRELAAEATCAHEIVDTQGGDHHLDGLTLFLHTRTITSIKAIISISVICYFVQPHLVIR